MITKFKTFSPLLSPFGTRAFQKLIGIGHVSYTNLYQACISFINPKVKYVMVSSVIDEPKGKMAAWFVTKLAMLYKEYSVCTLWTLSGDERVLKQPSRHSYILSLSKHASVPAQKHR